MAVIDITEEQRAYAEWFEANRELLEQSRWKEAFANYPQFTFGLSPWTPVTKPIAESTVALISSSGLYLAGQPPYDAADIQGDSTYRVIPRDASLAGAALAHDHYDHAAADKDVNCVFPLERLLELEAEGFIGRVADENYSFHGYNIRPWVVRETVAKELTERVVAAKVDAVLLVPV